jgi:hypothetical protein
MAERILVKAVKKFKDLVEQVDRSCGEQWMVDKARFKELNSTIYGELVQRIDVDPAIRISGRPKKSELIAMAEELGIEVPEGATNPEIARLIKEAQ